MAIFFLNLQAHSYTYINIDTFTGNAQENDDALENFLPAIKGFWVSMLVLVGVSSESMR